MVLKGKNSLIEIYQNNSRISSNFNDLFDSLERRFGGKQVVSIPNKWQTENFSRLARDSFPESRRVFAYFNSSILRVALN